MAIYRRDAPAAEMRRTTARRLTNRYVRLLAPRQTRQKRPYRAAFVETRVHELENTLHIPRSDHAAMDDAFANIASFWAQARRCLPPAPSAAAPPVAGRHRKQRRGPHRCCQPWRKTKALPRVRAVVFSKDRAFQLRCLLRSLARAPPAEVFVLWRADGETSAKAYASVQAEFRRTDSCATATAFRPAANSRLRSPTPSSSGARRRFPRHRRNNLGRLQLALRATKRLLAAHARLCPS